VRHRVFVPRHALHSIAAVTLLVPVADIVRREVVESPARSVHAPAFAAEAHSAAAPSGGDHVVSTPAAMAAPALDPREAAVAEALVALAPHVARMSHPEALRTAFQAYFNYKAAHAERVRKPYLYFVDLGLDNLSARGYVFDMEELTVMDGPFMVSHGRRSAAGDGVPTKFSNRPSSATSSLGLYLAEETYGFSGKSGGRAYTSVGLRLRGESGGFNDAARARGIVAHGAPYVTATRAGRSEGCPAMEPRRAERLLPMLANGGVVFVYSPNDARWLDADPWVQAANAD
jgi:hypothetical protein